MKTILAACAALLVAAPAASAQLPTSPAPPTQPAPPTTPTTPPPPAAEGKGSMEIASGLTDAGKRYVAAGQRVRLSGRV